MWWEAPAEAIPPELSQESPPSARTLERVVPIGQRQTVGEVMVTLTSLELYEEGLGVLRYLVSYEEDMFEGCYRIANPE